MIDWRPPPNFGVGDPATHPYPREFLDPPLTLFVPCVTKSRNSGFSSGNNDSSSELLNTVSVILWIASLSESMPNTLQSPSNTSDKTRSSYTAARPSSTCNIHQTMFLLYYRPQRSWAKVMFSQASVILSTGGSASVHAGIPSPWEQTPPRDQTPDHAPPRTRPPQPGIPTGSRHSPPGPFLFYNC